VPGEEMTFEELMAKVNEAIKTAVDAAKAELMAEIAKKQDGKKPFSIKRSA
jgi:hypothetical protein